MIGAEFKDAWRRQSFSPSMRLHLRRVIAAKPYVGSLAAVSVVPLIGSCLGVDNTPRVFPLAVLITVISYGLWPALLASVISALAYDDFLLPPVYLLMIAAIIVNSLAARVRRHALVADARALGAEALSAFTQSLAAAATVRDVLHYVTEKLSRALDMPVALILMDDDSPVISSVFPPETEPGHDCLRAAQAWWALRPDADSREAMMFGDWRFRALRGDGDPIRLIATGPRRGGIPVNITHDTLTEALAHQTGLAIERRMLRDRLEQSRIDKEMDKLRATVLTSISHDLRNPLAAITVAASLLETQWHAIDDRSKLLMARTIRHETERLDGFVGKLLDLTRIRSNMVEPRCQPVSVADVAGTVLHRVSTEFVGHRLTAEIPDDLQLANTEVVLLEQVLFNLVKNAAKYSPPGSLIRIVARSQQQSICITVLDEGPGLAHDDLERIFDNFYRAPAAQRVASGSGLGLAICGGFVDTMGGRIAATNRNDRTGAAFNVILPAATHRELHEIEA